MKALSNRKGTTLIELLIAMGLVAIIMSAAYAVLLTGMKTYNLNMNNSTSQSSLRTAMMQLTRQERKATAITAAADSLTMKINGTDHVYKASANKLQDNSTVIATDIKAISSSITGKMLSVTLTAADETTLTTQMHIP